MLPEMEIILPTVAPSSSNVPAFLAKLWKMVDDSSTDHLIGWSDEGSSFIIHNQGEFAATMLPHYYKHSNLASFVRQLNMYGFHKVVSVESGGLKSEKQEEMEFAHSYFIRGMDMLLDKIKRKVSSNRATTYPPSLKTEKVNEALNEVNLIRDRQEEMDSKLDTMRTENEALWREVVSLRQKHQQQQKIVNKLIHFLVTMVQQSGPPRMNTSVKRRFPNQLAIQESIGASKEMRLDTNPDKGASKSDDVGPTIRDITHETNGGNNMKTSVNVEMPDTPEPVVTSAVFLNPNISLDAMNRPISPTGPGMTAVDPSLVNPPVSGIYQQQQQQQQEQQQQLQQQSKFSLLALPTKRPALNREISKEDFDLETHFVQKDIDSLKDKFFDQVSVDSSFLSSLFSPEDPLPNLLYPTDEPSTSIKAEVEKLPLLDNTSASPNPTGFELDAISGPEIDTNLVTPKSSVDSMNMILNTPIVFEDDTDPLSAQLKK